MEHSYPLVETIVGGLVFAFILGMVAQRLRMPPLIGYLFAGIIVGVTGNTGRSSGSHLHLTCKKDGKSFNPTILLKIIESI